MFQKELLIVGTIASAVFVSVALMASLAVRTVQQDAKVVAEDTLPGLVNAGDAINRMNENWFNVHLLLVSESEQDRASLVDKINRNGTEPFWQRYKQSIFDEKDEQLFSLMESTRTEYMNARVRYFNLVEAGKIPAARKFLQAQLEPFFLRYRKAAVEIFKWNAAEGQGRADRIIRSSYLTPYVMGGFCVLVLLVGVFVGFKASLGAFSRPWNDKPSV